MTYLPNIPQGTDNLSTSQGQILTNFQQLESVFAADHFTWDYATAAQRGQHEQVSLPVTTTDPTLLTTAGEIYTKNISSLAELFFANSANTNVLWRGGKGTGLVGGSITTTPSGWMGLPNGFGIQWGYVTGLSGTTYNAVYANNALFTTWSLPFVILNGGGRTFGITTAPTANKTGFTVGLSSVSGLFNLSYIAIGF